MTKAPLRVLPTPRAVGEELAARILEHIAKARVARSRFLLGCPTGRTPRPIYAAMAERLAATREDVSHLILVMMDEYAMRVGNGFAYASLDATWSCHRYARVEIAERLNVALPQASRLREDAIWFPDPADPSAYDARINEAGGIDFFLLASGASDGHVAFNPPGSPRQSLTRMIELPDETRRDNLQTFPDFGTIDAVPRYGISVGIAAIAAAREAAMVVWGAGKRLTLERMLERDGYDSAWPATVIHEVGRHEILSDAEAAAH